ncbi:MAG: YtxH domain-containing protein [Clostridium sp.]|uniref:YtxH domain-containing protein n=1 Tax=Clostridium sp. TaxID=1506 RepID=UPI002FCA7D86
MKFSSGIVTGMMLGAAAGIMATPMMSGRTRRRIAKTSRKMAHSAERTMSDLVELMNMR